MSIMPRHYVHAASTSIIHPLHMLVGPLLLTMGSMMKKCREELPKILISVVAQGETEKTMMWYAVPHEKVWRRSVVSANDDGPWMMSGGRVGWMGWRGESELFSWLRLKLFKEYRYSLFSIC